LNAWELLIIKLREIGADGLYNPYGECGCGINDLEPCDNCDLSFCEAARYDKVSGLYYLIEEAAREKVDQN
jgi:hypothetical protein